MNVNKKAMQNPVSHRGTKVEVQTLAQIIEEMQERGRTQDWRIILDNESPLLIKIVSSMIPNE